MTTKRPAQARGKIRARRAAAETGEAVRGCKPRELTKAAAPEQIEPKTKIDQVVALLRRPEGATIDSMRAVTGWQAHSVRGALSGTIKKKLGLAISSEAAEDGRVYRIAPERGA